VADYGEAAVEREITREVPLCGPDGRLNREAVGWSRQPLHRCNLSGHWGRKKRWDYWCVTCADCVLAITYANCDYLGLASVMFLDRETWRCTEKAVVVPLGVGFDQPETVAGTDISLTGLGLNLEINEATDGTNLRASFSKLAGPSLKADLFAANPPGHESLNVVIPWSDDRFQFTSKHNTRPVSGEITLAGRRIHLGPENHAFGCLDYGRGIWPYRTQWNWGSASGVQGEHVVGLQFGGKWTDGTGMTENGLIIDGHLDKIMDDVAFVYDRRDFTKPWRVATLGSDQVDLRFVPSYEKRLNFDMLAAAGELHLCFGHYHGRVTSAAGRHYPIDDLFGWCEEVSTRW
jgi:hypothetical protein